MEKFLRQAMQKLGRLVEKMAATASQTKTKKRFSPIISRPETVLSKAKVQKILEVIEVESIAPLIANLSGKKTLHASATGSAKWDLLLEKGAEKIIDFEVGISTRNRSMVENSKGVLFARGNLMQAPFAEKSFDFLVFFAARLDKKDFVSSFSEIARILQDGSRVVISFTHPYLEYALNPKAGFLNRIDQYFMLLRKAGIYVEQMREVFVTPNLLSLVKPSIDSTELGLLEKIPFVVFFKGIRLRR